MRISNINVHFQINTGPHIKAGASNNRRGVYFKFDLVDLRLIEKVWCVPQLKGIGFLAMLFAQRLQTRYVVFEKHYLKTFVGTTS